MDKILYDIYFRGGIGPGESLDNVKENLAKLFKIGDDKIAAMFSGRAIVLKKDMEKDAALKYQSIIEKSGARVILREKTVASTTPAQPSSQSQPPPKKIVEPAKSSWDLAPTGSDLLNDTEKNPFKERKVDTSAISLVSAFAQMETNQAATPPPPNTDHISVADVGADILAEKPIPPSTPDLDLSGFSVDPMK